MSVFYIRSLDPVGQYQLVEAIAMGEGSAPPRPHPEPPLGIWGPTDPRPSHPIAGIPGFPGYTPPGTGEPPLGIWGPTDPRPSNPIAGIPGLPGYNPPGPPAGPGIGTRAIIVPAPVQDPPATPPAGLPPDSTQMLLLIQGAGAPIPVWVPPYISTGPVTPPASPA